MPSIEIACIGLLTPIRPPTLSFAVECEAGLRSHRSPNPLFQADFDALSGSLYHLGNPSLRDGGSGPFFAYELLSEASRQAEPPSFLEFASDHLQGVREFLAWLLDQSPESALLFTSDWQFGPTPPHRSGPVSLPSFWASHDAQELLLNSAYLISRAA